MVSILLLEDDLVMAAQIKQFLENQHFHCEVMHNGEVFLRERAKFHYDIFLLDINVPSVNGLEVCKRIRAEDKTTPILMLTAYGAVQDKVEAFNFGADDYLVKPFHFDELLARIKSLLRRSKNDLAQDEIIKIADLEINLTQMHVSRAGQTINLTLKEYKLLELLALAKGRVLSKQTIAEQVWDINFETGTNTIEVYISFLRNKIDKGFEPKLIHTRIGYGYYLKIEQE
ncbi:response regulator transcription factor [Thermoflexibacter ruber]|uniref:DNA-binding response regulator, OmpR family, contains REC and winged-helix (WHTH) domain n=1 Tax=Thermoflexibacter ruber TaxID=1003 RepID=A0A1I2AL91_9BACT|nr:response regulator transcription factor [Thermoflexibacter ruber]SFE43640.1 DNA-binding response regulator, OmpR family, contains REC and winged-helix (wHTH) domain [Thermoflexibacter ruber]